MAQLENKQQGDWASQVLTDLDIFSNSFRIIGNIKLVKFEIQILIKSPKMQKVEI